jgi:repressor LexA
LEKKGFLHREDLKSRALRPLVTADDFVEVPVLGKVAAGQPILAVQNYEDSVKIDRFFIGQNREVFALRVKGDSMIEAGIFDGDYVFIRKQLQAATGEIVVAMIGDEATVKRYYPEGDSIRFQPANAAMAPIIVRRHDFRSVNLLGVVIGVYRKMG